VGGWVGVTLAAFFAGVEFGIQPLLFHTADGAPLYAPYPLAVSIPAMVIPPRWSLRWSRGCSQQA